MCIKRLKEIEDGPLSLGKSCVTYQDLEEKSKDLIEKKRVILNGEYSCW